MLKWQYQNTVSPAKCNSWSPLIQPAYKICNSGVLVCTAAAVEDAFVWYSQFRSLTIPYIDHLQCPCLPSSDFSTRVVRIKGRTPCLTGISWQIRPVRYSQVRSITTGTVSCWSGTSNSLKPLCFQEECAGWSLLRSTSLCCSTEHKWVNGTSFLEVTHFLCISTSAFLIKVLIMFFLSVPVSQWVPRSAEHFHST